MPKPAYILPPSLGCAGDKFPFGNSGCAAAALPFGNRGSDGMSGNPFGKTGCGSGNPFANTGWGSWNPFGKGSCGCGACMPFGS
mgnify:CR=1 FL=1